MSKRDETRERGDVVLAKSLGARIRTLREASGLEGTRLAESAGMKQAYLWRLESGRTIPSIRSLARIALALDIPLTELLVDVDYSGIALEARPYRSPNAKADRT